LEEVKKEILWVFVMCVCRKDGGWFCGGGGGGGL